MNATVKAPRPTASKVAWICLAIAWVAFLIPVPGIGAFLGIPLALAGFVLAVFTMSQNGTRSALGPLLASVIASPVIYIVGWLIFAAVIVGSGTFAKGLNIATAQLQSAGIREGLGIETGTMQGETYRSPRDAQVAQLFGCLLGHQTAVDSSYRSQVVE